MSTTTTPANTPGVIVAAPSPAPSSPALDALAVLAEKTRARGGEPVFKSITDIDGNVHEFGFLPIKQTRSFVLAATELRKSAEAADGIGSMDLTAEFVALLLATPEAQAAFRDLYQNDEIDVEEVKDCVTWLTEASSGKGGGRPSS